MQTPIPIELQEMLERKYGPLDELSVKTTFFVSSEYDTTFYKLTFRNYSTFHSRDIMLDLPDTVPIQEVVDKFEERLDVEKLDHLVIIKVKYPQPDDLKWISRKQ